ncbi:hypothetical protein [Treponema sp.]
MTVIKHHHATNRPHVMLYTVLVMLYTVYVMLNSFQHLHVYNA